MQFGAQLVNYFCTWDDTTATMLAVQKGRWHSLWWSDHFLPPVGRRDLEGGGALEGWSLLTAAAALTTPKRRGGSKYAALRLGLLVSGNTYRNPALLAKMAATLDQMSHGRLILGIGSAWFKREHEAYGWRFPPLKERCDRLDEALAVIKLLFTEGDGGFADYQGKYYRLDHAPLSPPCHQKPHLPILVGGNGEKRTLKTCAKYADICNIDFNNPGGVDVFKHKLDVLKRHCDAIGRDADEIKKTLLIPLRLEDDEAKARQLREQRGGWVLYGPPAYVIDMIGGYVDAGCEEMMFSAVPTKPEHFERIDADVLSAFD